MVEKRVRKRERVKNWKYAKKFLTINLKKSFKWNLLEIKLFKLKKWKCKKIEKLLFN